MKDQFDRLSDELIENIINTPDAEILKETKEEYGDPTYLANKVRKMISKSKKKYWRK